MPTGIPTKMKPCKICGDMFLPEKPSSKICAKSHYLPCPICGNITEWNTTRAIEPCSKECRREATKRKNLEKYGVEHPMQSKQVQANHRQAMLDKYGVASPLQSEEIRNRAIQTNRERFGTDWALGSQHVLDKSKDTMLQRYGTEYAMQSNEVREKSRQTCLERYGVEHAIEFPEIRERSLNAMIEKFGVPYALMVPEIAERVSDKRKQDAAQVLEKAKKTWLANLGVDNPSKSPLVIDKITSTFIARYGVKRAVNVPEFRQKMIDTMTERYGVEYYTQSKDMDHFRISKINKQFSELLTQADIPHELEFSIGRKVYDLRIGQTLVEINPSYTHNYIGNHWNREGLSESYHLNKSQLAEENGYQCVHVFDWDDPEKIINMLRRKKTVHARKCQIYKLNLDYTNEFLDNYHLQSKCKGQLVCLGLVYEGELYQVMTFGKPRYDKKFDVELLRLCTKPGYQVVGGASKLFKYFTQFYEVGSVISYCDISKFSGNVYEQIGMKLIRTTPPQEIWSRGTDKVTANLLRQRGYDQLFGTDYGKGTSNDELMLQNGWLPVYDCGQRVYAYYK